MTYRKAPQHTLVCKDSSVARDKINVSSEMGGEGGSPQKLSTFFNYKAVVLIFNHSPYIVIVLTEQTLK